MNTEEGNKLIAKFDNCINDTGYFERNGFMTWYFSHLEYHSSWDWQLPVWNKMYELCTANFKLSITKYYEQEKGLHSAIRLNQPEISIPYLIDLIEWYNKEQSVKESDTTKAT